MKRLCYLLVSLFVVSSVHAQRGGGAEAGYHFSDFTVKISGKIKDTQPLSSFRVGGIADWALTDNLFFQPGLFYVANGYKAALTKGNERYVMQTLELPVNLQYKVGVLGTNRFFVGAGPYVAFSWDGYYRIYAKPIESKRDMRIGYGATDEIKPVSLGAGVNIGYQITEGLFMRLRAQACLIEQYPGSANMSIKSQSASLTIGYLFYKREQNGQLRIKRTKHVGKQ